MLTKTTHLEISMQKVPYFLSLISWALMAQGFSVGAQEPVPVGPEFRVNTYSTNFQSGPAIAPDGSGGFAVVWTSNGSNGNDSSGSSIQGQRLAANGIAVGAEFQINSYTTNSQISPSISPDGAGGFVVVWTSNGSNGTDSDDRSIQAQRFDSDGAPVGAEFQVNSITVNSQVDPSVDEDGAGGFVVTWDSDGSNGTDSDDRSIQAQRFGSDGSPEGSQFQVNSFTTGTQFDPSVGSDGAGGFTVTWASFGSDGTDSDSASIQAQRFASRWFSCGFPVSGQLIHH